MISTICHTRFQPFLADAFAFSILSWKGHIIGNRIAGTSASPYLRSTWSSLPLHSSSSLSSQLRSKSSVSWACACVARDLPESFDVVVGTETVTVWANQCFSEGLGVAEQEIKVVVDVTVAVWWATSIFGGVSIASFSKSDQSSGIPVFNCCMSSRKRTICLVRYIMYAMSISGRTAHVTIVWVFLCFNNEGGERCGREKRFRGTLRSTRDEGCKLILVTFRYRYRSLVRDESTELT